MTSSIDPQNEADFDAYVGTYHDMHAAVLGVSGEEPEYFAQYKSNVVRELIGPDTRPVLDYGCGIGNLTVLLSEVAADIHGYDPSARSIALARERVPSAKFYDTVGDLPPGRFGTIVVANVLHHVDPAARGLVVAEIAPLLAPGGRLVIFEHNRWNPLTVRAVRRCEFDVGVQLLSKPELVRLLRTAGFSALRSRFVVFFPHFLRGLRRFESHMGRLPIGAQVCVWATRTP
jgi:SAM-dependent methyltransferase